MAKSKLIASVIAVLSFSSLALMAQGVPPPNDSAPIDAGIGMFLVGVAGYGYTQIKNREKK